MIVGIDLGTTNSAIAYMDEKGTPVIIPNREGGRITPSVILFEDGNPVVGSTAKSSSVSYPENVVQFIKRQMGNENYKFINGDGESFTPEELSAIILKRIKEDAESAIGDRIEKAVITVPAYFDEAQRKATQDAGAIAGLNVIRIINEPTAAALAYGFNKSSVNQNILVYDLGGGTFDATIMTIKNGDIFVKATDGAKNLGGFDFDNLIIEYIIKEFYEKHGIDLYDDLEALQELREKAEACKKALSTREKSPINISSSGKSLKVEITKEQFNEMIRPLINRSILYMRNVLEDSGLSWGDLNKIILVGGSTRINLISELIEKETGIKPSNDVNPDEAVAIGAAIQAAMSSEELDIPARQTKIVDVNSHSLGVLAWDKEKQKYFNTIILKKNTPIPAECCRVYYTAVDNQKRIEVNITEGEDEDPEYVRVIGTISANLPINRMGGSPIRFVICYDENAIIKFNVVDELSKTNLSETSIHRKSNLSENEVFEKKNKVSKYKIE